MDSSSVIWVVLNQVVSKSLMALKFLMAASFLGPKAMGVVGVLLVLYAIVESLTEFGLIHAVIQSKKVPKKAELKSIWWALFVRGLGVSVIIFLIGTLFPITEYQEDFYLSALILAAVAFLKSAASTNLYLAQRNRSFKKIFILGGVGGVFDLFVMLLFLFQGYGVVSVFAGLVVAEFIKVILTYFIFSRDSEFLLTLMNPSFNVSKFANYGKWIWGSNCLNLLLNQSDKLVTNAMLGSTSLGLYQMGGRLAQLGVADVAIAFGQYLFPSFSRLNSDKERLTSLLSKSMAYMLVFSISSALLVGVLAELVPIIVGEAWKESVNILRVLVVSMANGAMISVLVAYHRAVGHPKRVTVASLFQLVVFVPSLVGLTYFYGVMGTAISTVLGTLTCLVVLYDFLKKDGLSIHLNLSQFFYAILAYLLLISISLMIESVWVSSGLVVVGFLQVLFKLYRVEREAYESCY